MLNVWVLLLYKKKKQVKKVKNQNVGFKIFCFDFTIFFGNDFNSNQRIFFYLADDQSVLLLNNSSSAGEKIYLKTGMNVPNGWSSRLNFSSFCYYCYFCSRFCFYAFRHGLIYLKYTSSQSIRRMEIILYWRELYDLGILKMDIIQNLF